MSKLKDRIKARLTIKDAENNNADIEPVADSVLSADTSTDSEKPAAVVDALAQDSPADEEVEIYSATLAQIEKWHNYGGLTAQYLLKVCNFGYYDKTFDKFKIGYDKEGHTATFALDESHCYKIFFDSSDAAPLDDVQAEKVLQKIISLQAI